MDLGVFPEQNNGKTPPNVTAYGDGQATQLVTDFQSLVSGVQQHGCGLEAQLESWYRFLIVPDPYGSITLTSDSPLLALLPVSRVPGPQFGTGASA